MRHLEHYQNQLSYVLKQVSKYNNICNIIAVAKLVFFVLLIIMGIYYYLHKAFAPALLLLPILFFIVLSFFGQKYIDLLNSYKKLQTLIIYEIEFINGNYNNFRYGNKFIDYNHNYSYDLDIFEKGSIFHHLNRCATTEGEIFLKSLVLETKRDCSTVKEYQESVKELINFRDISEKISSLGIDNIYSLKDFIETASSDVKNISLNVLVFTYISITITLFTVVLSFIDIIPSFIPFGLFIFQIIISSFFSKQVINIYAKTNKTNKSSKIYCHIAEILKDTSFKTKKLQNSISHIKDMHIQLTALHKINSELDQRNNGIIYLLTNGFFLRDIILSYKLGKWFNLNKDKISLWVNTVSEFDALNSISTFAFNHQDLIFPEINSNKILEAKDMGHPLISNKKRIGNNISLNKLHSFAIITGANMAGKSTFIRSIGINMVLASIGAPVAAKEFIFSPTSLYSSMRTSDKLLESSSYFHAELQRLEKIKNAVKNESASIVLLDEILKGTNSIDKLNGSKMVLMKFITLNIIGILATHDVALGDLASENKDNFKNYYFDFQVDDDGNMHFDYKLKEGVSTNMNAAILLKSILDK